MDAAGSSSLADAAYRQIEEMIVIRRLPPGAMISEARLAEEIGCGRTPIREALLRLKYEGYIEVFPSRGAMVSNIDVHKQLELLEVRRPLDDVVARLAAERATPAERAEMRRLGEAIQQSARDRDDLAYLAANRAIHEIKVKATHNSMFISTLARVNGLSRRFWYTYVVSTDAFTTAALLHSQTLSAIADRDPSAAAAATAKLLDLLEGLTRQAIEPAAK